MKATNSVLAGDLEIAYLETGVPSGTPVVLSHGFPYDVHAFDDAAAVLAEHGARVLVPYLRGYGPTRFVKSQTMRSGQQAALASDLLAFLDALQVERAVLGGFDWGGRAACIVAALYPQRVIGLVTGEGYNVQHLPTAGEPASPVAEAANWYQYYFHSERGRTALLQRRDELCRYLWQTWSPHWHFDDATFARTAVSFGNPDFVDVVVHSYKHRYRLAAGDPQYDAMERALEARPQITVPTISLEGVASAFRTGVYARNASSHYGTSFEMREVAVVGHNVPQEAPLSFARAVKNVLDGTSGA